MNNKSTTLQSKFTKSICLISIIMACFISSIYKKILVTPTSQVERLLSAIPLEIFLLIIILMIGYKIGFKNVSLSLPKWKKLYWMIPEVLLILTILTTIEKPISQPSNFIIGKLLLLAILVGIYEELLSRGIILHILSRFGGVKRALIFSGLIFGLLHFSNFDGSNGVDTFQQILETAAAGIYAGVLTLTLRSLIPLIFTHIFFDFFQFVSMYFNDLNQTTVVNSVSPSLFDISCYILPLLYLLVALVVFMFERKNITEYVQELKSKSAEIVVTNFEFYLNILAIVISIITIHQFF